MRLPAFLLAGLATLAATAVTAAVPAPKVKAASFEQLAKPLPLPYDEGADAKAVVAKAKAKAKASGKLLLIDLGGNWCLDCRILAGTVELPDLKPFVEKHYVEAVVDVGRFDKNLDIPAHYGFTKRLAGVPAVLIVDPKTDKLINAGDTTALSDARSMNPQGLADYLAKWAR
ncbi:thiol-disulfide isomerase/thioredoxin [Sphingomonas vulcanisoli]|uniref:Thiol-disulfide isomerase/thioredoxin n=1 Tax=Sphingomonas vulcanisoli TaxID=1658060 RepID=A0ABX0TWQ1_9SPHN|nr:thioredoxin family protein [Sphingomonas vulcanisoli]NIJ08870.1 thiol-disulfide isomerase/thioredoxin [Sphingomonas vulcanisoli]